MHGPTHIAVAVTELIRECNRILQRDLPFAGLDKTPEPLQEAELSFHIGVIPFQILFRRSLEQDEHPGRVRPIAIDDRCRIHAVVLRLRHLLEQHLKGLLGLRVHRVVRIGHIGRSHITTGAGVAVGHPLHHALGQQPLEGFTHIDQAPIPQCFGEEAGIEQVKDGVFDSTHVLLDRQPFVDGVLAEWLLAVVGICEPKEIPGGTHEGVHRVRFPLGIAPAGGTRHIHPVLLLTEWGPAFPGQINATGQFHRQLIARHRDRSAAGAVNHGDRATPVALARDQPIPKAVRDLAAGPSVFRSRGGDGGFGCGRLAAIKVSRVDQDAGFRPGVAITDCRTGPLGINHLTDGEAVALGEHHVALVMGRNSHHRSGSIVGQNVISDPDRQRLAIDRVGHRGANRHATLRTVITGALDGAQPGHVVAEALDRIGTAGIHQRLHERVLGG